MKKAIYFLLPCLVCLGLFGCKAQSDVGQTCQMTMPCGDAGTCGIPESKIEAAFDYLSRGASECDDQVCVKPRATDIAGSGGIANGFCTKCCIEDSDCEIDFNGDKGNYKCDGLLLSDPFLQELAKNNPDKADDILGNNPCTRYCVRK